MTDAHTPLTGGCLCGAVRYEIRAKPVYGALCYCSDCRTLTSSHSSLIFAPERAFHVTGELRAFTKPSDAGNAVTRYFCPVCGAGVYSKGSVARVVIVKAGTLDDPAAFKPEAAVFTSRAPDWDRPQTGLPHYPDAPPKA